MELSTHRFDLSSQPKKSIIKVIGVGGGGSNAVNNMYKQGIQDVAFVVCNTDEQALKSSPVPHKLQIGINLTSGLGAGANPEVGKNAAIESKEEIAALLDDGTKMLFVTAGMGGGTGTGAAPVIASIANKLDILTVGIVTIPFSFEGKKKLLQAQTGIQELRQHCDTVLVILNDKLRQVLGNLSIGNAFAGADNVVTTAAKSIAEIITVPGYINVDFQDVKTVLKKAGAAVMGSAQAEGEGRARKAAELALTSPLLEYKDIRGAKKILLSIVYRHVSEIQMDEFTTITDFIQEQVGDDAEMIFGCGPDKRLKEGIRVTVIATGFEDSQSSQVMQQQAEAATPCEAAQQRNIPGMHQLAQEEYLAKIAAHPEEANALNQPTYNYQELKKPNQQANKDMRKSLHHTRRMVGTLSLPFDALEAKRSLLREKAQRRIQELTHQQANGLSEDILKEYMEVPAYRRQGIQLEEFNMIPEKDIIRYHLTENSDS